MSSLQSLEQNIQQRLKSVDEKERSQQAQLQIKMDQVEQRHTRFSQLADKLMAEVIDPRMEKLASFFDNAELPDRQERGTHSCVCRFDHSARYPASVQLTLSVAHDEEIENLLLVYDLDILPIFIKFMGHDQAAISLDDLSPDNLNQEQITDWVDEKILLFVDTYLQIEQTDQYHQSILVTDPICSMRFRKSIAAGEKEYVGHTYFFCSPGCQEKFVANPQRYISSHVG